MPITNNEVLDWLQKMDLDGDIEHDSQLMRILVLAKDAEEANQNAGGLLEAERGNPFATAQTRSNPTVALTDGGSPGSSFADLQKLAAEKLVMLHMKKSADDSDSLLRYCQGEGPEENDPLEEGSYQAGGQRGPHSGAASVESVAFSILDQNAQIRIQAEAVKLVAKNLATKAEPLFQRPTSAKEIKKEVKALVNAIYFNEKLARSFTDSSAAELATALGEPGQKDLADSLAAKDKSLNEAMVRVQGYPKVQELILEQIIRATRRIMQLHTDVDNQAEVDNQVKTIQKLIGAFPDGDNKKAAEASLAEALLNQIKLTTALVAAGGDDEDNHVKTIQTIIDGFPDGDNKKAAEALLANTLLKQLEETIQFGLVDEDKHVKTIQKLIDGLAGRSDIDIHNAQKLLEKAEVIAAERKIDHCLAEAAALTTKASKLLSRRYEDHSSKITEYLTKANELVAAAEQVKTSARPEVQASTVLGPVLGAGIEPQKQAIKDIEAQLPKYKQEVEAILKVVELEKLTSAAEAARIALKPPGADPAADRLKAFQALQAVVSGNLGLGSLLVDKSTGAHLVDDAIIAAAQGPSDRAQAEVAEYNKTNLLTTFVADQAAIMTKANFTSSQTLGDLRKQDLELEKAISFITQAKHLSKEISSPDAAQIAAQHKAAALILNESKFHILLLQFLEDIKTIEAKITAEPATGVKAHDERLQAQWQTDREALVAKYQADREVLVKTRQALGETIDLKRSLDMRRSDREIQALRNSAVALQRIEGARIAAQKLYEPVAEKIKAYYTPPPPTLTWIAQAGQLAQTGQLGKFETKVVPATSPWSATSLPAAPSISALEIHDDDVLVRFQRRKVASDEVVRSVADLDCNPVGGTTPLVRVAIELDPVKKMAANKTPRLEYDKLSEESKQLAALQQANLLVTSCSDLKKSNIYIRCQNDVEANKLYAALLALGVPDKQIKSANSNIVRAGKMTWESTIIKRNLGGMEHKAALMRKDLRDMKAKVTADAPHLATPSHAEVDLTRMKSDDTFAGRLATPKKP